MTQPELFSAPKRITALFTDLLAIGGVQEAGRLTCRALEEIARANGWGVELLSLNDPAGRQNVPGCESSLLVQGFGCNKRKFVLAAMRQAWAMEGGGIVLAAHPHLAAPAVWMRRVRPSLQIVVMAHGLEVWQPLAGRRRDALGKARYVFAPSSDTVRRLTNAQGVSAAKVRRLPWPLSATFLLMAGDPKALPLPARFPRGRTILTVGRWAASERYKGADELILAIAALRAAVPDLQMVAVGSGDDLPRLRAIAAEAQLQDRVHFLENLTNEEVAACYARCDFFALPSTGEGYGLVFLEAMAFGKAVVGVAAGGVTDIVRDGENGLLVPAGNRERLVQALQTLLMDDSLRARLGAAGAETVKREYGFAVFRARLQEILVECCATAGRR